MIAAGVRNSLIVGLLGMVGSPLLGQVVISDPSIANLPRPGYQPQNITVGSVLIQPSLDLRLAYDNNIFAAPDQRVDDMIVIVSPRVDFERSTSTFNAALGVHGDIIRYASNSRENVEIFGAKLETSKAVSKRQSLSATASFDRSFERRTDPEAQTDRSRSPSLINIAAGDVQYRYAGVPLGISIEAGVVKTNYLSGEDAARDLTTSRVAVRGSYNLGKIALYVEPYANRRDFRLPASRGGTIGGDQTTFGGLVGISVDVADKLRGNMGVGVFSANPDGSQFKSFTGLAINGRLAWRPRVRTAITLDAFRGDVATVRTGASGRIDTRVSLGIDQEARHNLILHAAGGIRAIHYRGSGGNQTYYSGEVEGRYLVNRNLTLVLSTNYTHRTADDPDERFNRFLATFGVRLAY